MRVLGLNGWPGRGHDAAACLVEDGHIVAVAEEERFARRKHAYGLAPHHAAAFCLSKAGLTLSDIDVVAFGWDIPRLHRDRGFGWPHSGADALEMLLPAALFPRTHDPEFEFVAHHMAHAASVYHLSRHQRAAVLVIDGQGEVESASLMHGRDGELTTLATVPAAWSLGYFYDAVCQYSGLGADQAGKLMGLAAYGTVGDDTFGAFEFSGSGYSLPLIEAGLRSATEIDENDVVLGRWLDHLAGRSPLPANTARQVYDPRTGRFRWQTDRDPFDYKDMAAQAQSALERAVGGLVDQLLALTGETVLHISGGCGFNATLNGKLLEHPGASEIFVQPVAGDAGVAIGAAVWIAARAGERIQPMSTSIAWGAEFADGVVRELLDESGLSYETYEDIAAEVAKRIGAQEVVGWFQGPGEIGPRALGHRSILADPKDPGMRDRINLRIKKREWWRPLAPSIRAENLTDHIDTSAALPYMVVTRPLLPASREALPSIDHVDGTTRPQSVHAHDEELYHRLLGHLADETGVPVVLNTSFNGNSEPVVWTPEDALRTFTRLGLDSLAIGSFLVRKA